jgi:hypothetical protein
MHPGRNTFRPGRIVGTKNRRDDYCGQGLLVLFAKTKRRPPAGLGREFFFILPMVIEQTKLTLRQSILNIST